MLSMVTIVLAYSFVKFFPQSADFSFFWQVIKGFIQIGAVALLVQTILTFYYFCKFLFNKDFDLEITRQLILFAIIFALSYGYSVSNALPNSYFASIALFIGIMLNAKTVFNIQKNRLIYLSIFVVLFMGISLKTISPCNWHCWISGNITGKLKETKIRVMKGIKLQQEV